MEKEINIAVDIETLSTKPTAAIIGIAAKVFDFKEDGDSLLLDGSSIRYAIDATSCAMYGLDFDQKTVEWWSKKPQEAKEQFLDTISIRCALVRFIEFIQKEKEKEHADKVLIWCQGTDFDISILRNAFAKVYGDSSEEIIPWKHADVRDSRTFILEGIRLIAPNEEKPYSLIPRRNDWNKHDALSDCLQLIHNVRWVNKELNERIYRL